MRNAEEAAKEKLDRFSVPELDAVLGRPFKVLDDGLTRGPGTRS